MRPRLHQLGAFRKHLHALARVYPRVAVNGFERHALGQPAACFPGYRIESPPQSHVQFPAVRAPFCHHAVALGGMLPGFILGHGAYQRIRAASSQAIRKSGELRKVGEKQAVRLEPVGAIFDCLLKSCHVGAETAQVCVHVVPRKTRNVTKAHQIRV